jgi:hypothetical protein
LYDYFCKVFNVKDSFVVEQGERIDLEMNDSLRNYVFSVLTKGVAGDTFATLVQLEAFARCFKFEVLLDIAGAASQSGSEMLWQGAMEMVTDYKALVSMAHALGAARIRIATNFRNSLCRRNISGYPDAALRVDDEEEWSFCPPYSPPLDARGTLLLLFLSAHLPGQELKEKFFFLPVLDEHLRQSVVAAQLRSPRWRRGLFVAPISVLDALRFNIIDEYSFSDDEAEVVVAVEPTTVPPASEDPLDQPDPDSEDDVEERAAATEPLDLGNAISPSASGEVDRNVSGLLENVTVLAPTPPRSTPSSPVRPASAVSSPNRRGRGASFSAASSSPNRVVSNRNGSSDTDDNGSDGGRSGSGCTRNVHGRGRRSRARSRGGVRGRGSGARGGGGAQRGRVGVRRSRRIYSSSSSSATGSDSDAMEDNNSSLVGPLRTNANAAGSDAGRDFSGSSPFHRTRRRRTLSNSSASSDDRPTDENLIGDSVFLSNDDAVDSANREVNSPSRTPSGSRADGSASSHGSIVGDPFDVASSSSAPNLNAGPASSANAVNASTSQSTNASASDSSSANDVMREEDNNPASDASSANDVREEAAATAPNREEVDEDYVNYNTELSGHRFQVTIDEASPQSLASVDVDSVVGLFAIAQFIAAISAAREGIYGAALVRGGSRFATKVYVPYAVGNFSFLSFFLLTKYGRIGVFFLCQTQLLRRQVLDSMAQAIFSFHTTKSSPQLPATPEYLDLLPARQQITLHLEHLVHILWQLERRFEAGIQIFLRGIDLKKQMFGDVLAQGLFWSCFSRFSIRFAMDVGIRVEAPPGYILHPNVPRWTELFGKMATVFPMCGIPSIGNVVVHLSQRASSSLRKIKVHFTRTTLTHPHTNKQIHKHSPKFLKKKNKLIFDLFFFFV